VPMDRHMVSSRDVPQDTMSDFTDMLVEFSHTIIRKGLRRSH